MWTSLLIGDILHNLRSALDNLVYALAQNHTGRPDPPNPRRIFFPITLDEAKFKAAAAKMHDVLPAEALATLETLQPYRMPLVPIAPSRPHSAPFTMTTTDKMERQSLNILNVWSNFDKHRAIHVTYVDIIGGWAPQFGRFSPAWIGRPIVHGTVLGTLKYPSPPPYDETQVPIHFTPRVGINEDLEGYGAGTDLGIIHNHVAVKILPQVEVFFT